VKPQVDRDPRQILSFENMHNALYNQRPLACWIEWRRQDLLRGGAKLLIMSWGTHGELQGRVQQLFDD